MWWYLEVGPSGGNSVCLWIWRWSSHDRTGALIRGRDAWAHILSRTHTLALFLLTTEDKERRWPSISHKEGPHQEPNYAVTLISDFGLQNWEINVFCLSHPINGILLQQPKLRHPAFNPPSAGSTLHRAAVMTPWNTRLIMPLVLKKLVISHLTQPQLPHPQHYGSPLFYPTYFLCLLRSSSAWTKGDKFIYLLGLLAIAWLLLPKF